MGRQKILKNEMSLHSFARLAVCVGLAVLFLSVGIFSMINNSKQSKSLYDELIAADQAGGEVEASLNKLRTFIYSHMNTTIGSETGIKPPIQLKGTYDRLVAAEQDRVAKINESLSQVAQAECERLNPTDFSGRNRVPCVAEYIEKNGAKPEAISDIHYKFDFVSPRWSPDLAGISLLIGFIFSLVSIISIGLHLHTRHIIRQSR